MALPEVLSLGAVTRIPIYLRDKGDPRTRNKRSASGSISVRTDGVPSSQDHRRNVVTASSINEVRDYGKTPRGR